MPQKEQIALMTGATSGFGKIIAQHLVQKNYSLFFLARSEEKAKQLIESLNKGNPQANIDFIICDLSSFHSIVEASHSIREKCPHIDLLILNAGLWNFEFQETTDGIEETLQVNLLSPILLFLKIRDLIPVNTNSKVIFTASGLHQGEIQFNDLEFRNKFSGFKAYRQSKLGVILITRLLAKHSEFSSISFYSVHPGIVKTDLGKNANWISRTIFRLMGSSLESGAKTHIRLIDELAGNLTSGEYYANCQITKASKESYDLEKAEKLFDIIKGYIKPFSGSSTKTS
ncbi:MAG: SDR family NAD(P)-dependent oxidoreductase [Crocinitomicaceae bacterium]|nr:SDR family NAD(P)-dependent oxidoreductase [Crocinitomicaceae bacterium]